MNASFSILQKLKNQFYQAVSNKNDFHVAFAPFAFTMSNDDFYFLKSAGQTGDEARKFMKEQSEFSLMANAVLMKPHLWSLDGDHLLYNTYRDILQNALLIDPDILTPEETTKLKKATEVLYDKNKNESAKYIAYKDYAERNADMELALLDHQSVKNTIDPADTVVLNKWESDDRKMQSAKRDLLIEWQVKGAKSAVEAAKATYESILFGKTEFIQKWHDAKNIKMSSPNLLTDSFGVEFLTTTCIPNAICDYKAPIWKKITIPQSEIATLTKSFTDEVPAELLMEFGNVEPELESISFEYCIVDIIRPWFDEKILNNQYWKFSDNNDLVSKGDESMKGSIPAYPVKIIFSKNVDLVFKPNSQVNEDIKTKLRSGNRLFFGSLMLKTIPMNLADNKVNSLRVQQISSNELNVITKVAANTTPAEKAKLNNINKFQMIQMINRTPQKEMKRTMEVKSVSSVNTARLMKFRQGNPAFTATAFTVVNPVVKPAPTIRNIKAVHMVNPTMLRPMPMFIKPVIPVVHPPQPSAPTVGSIKGKVFDQSNQPVPVVEIQLMQVNNASSQSILSLDDGTYIFEDLEKGKYEMKVKKEGFVLTEKQIEVTGNSVQDFLMKQEPVPTESFQVMGVICKKLPLLPNPIPGAAYN